MTVTRVPPAPNLLLYGDVGTGKTTSLATFIRAGVDLDLPLKVIAIFTEPNAEEALLDGMRLHAKPGEKSLPMDRLFYRYIPPAVSKWSIIKEVAQKVNLLGYKQLTEMKSGMGKENSGQFLDLIDLLSNFVDQHGHSHGPVDDLDPSYLVCVDSISGMNVMARALNVGMKPSLHQGEWGVAMHMEDTLITKVVADTQCFTAFLGHVDKEMDEIIGKPQYMPAFLGKKLAPKVPSIFSDVVNSYRDGKKYYWSTMRRDYSSLKVRNLTLEDTLKPDFKPIVNAWLKRKRMVEAGELPAPLDEVKKEQE